MRQSSAFREAVQQCEEIVRTELGLPLDSPLYGERAGVATDQQSGRPDWYAGAAAFTYQYGLSEFWRGCGIEPSVVLGYGIGEIVAASVTGALTLSEGLRLAIANAENSPAKLEACASQIRYRTPRIPLLSNSLQPAMDGTRIHPLGDGRYSFQSSVPSGEDARAVSKRELCGVSLYGRRFGASVICAVRGEQSARHTSCGIRSGRRPAPVRRHRSKTLRSRLPLGNGRIFLECWCQYNLAPHVSL